MEEQVIDVYQAMRAVGVPGETIKEGLDKFCANTLKLKLVDQRELELAFSELNKEQVEVKPSKLVEHSVNPSSFANRLQQVKDFIESRELMKALKFVDALQSDYPSSALVLAYKALVYERNCRPEALSICYDAKEHFFSDISVLPDVLSILKTVCIRLGRLDVATSYYENACEQVSNNLEMMREFLDCYVRDSSFIKQLKHSITGAFSLLKKLAMNHNLDEPETFLVYISVTEQQAKNDLAREILSKLLLTLAAVEVGSLCIVGEGLLSHVCDYAAAAEVFRQKLDSCSPDDGECYLNELVSSLEDPSKWCGGMVDNQVYPPSFLACKLSQLSENESGSQLLKALPQEDLETGRSRCLLDRKEDDALEEIVYDYFSWIGNNVEVFFQVLTRDAEYKLITDLLCLNCSPNVLKEELSRILTISRINFIILAADGKLTTTYSSKALTLMCDKLKHYDDLGIAVSANWKNMTKIDRNLRQRMRCLKIKGQGRRPTVRQFAELISKESFSLASDNLFILGAFDELEDGQPPVPCISYVSGSETYDVHGQYYCTETGSVYVNSLLERYLHEDTGLGEAIELVEKALVAIIVIERGQTARVLAREDISTTLFTRHRSFLESWRAKGRGIDGEREK
ncbi:hypothetical protein MKW98_029340, partial [Papaver atlanticum]